MSIVASKELLGAVGEHVEVAIVAEGMESGGALCSRERLRSRASAPLWNCRTVKSRCAPRAAIAPVRPSQPSPAEPSVDILTNNETPPGIARNDDRFTLHRPQQRRRLQHGKAHAVGDDGIGRAAGRLGKLNASTQ